MRLLFPLFLALISFLPQPLRASDTGRVDFKNFTYPWYPSGYKPPYRARKVTLKDGEYVVDRRGNVEDILFSFANVSHADLTGDGKDEAVVTITAIFNPNGSYACIFVYSLRGNYPRFLWKHETGDRAYGGLRSIRVSNRNLVIEQYGVGNELPCMICPKEFVRSTYRWNGRRFLKMKRESFPHEGVGMEFLGYPGDSQ